MDWQIKAFSRRCGVTGRAFEDGDRYISFLFIDQESRELARSDIAEAEAESFQPDGEVICRWSREFRKEAESGPSARQQRESIESVFISLFEGESEDDPEERETLKQVLGVFLERKRILKDRGFCHDGAFQVMEHRKTGNVFLVPTGRMTAESLPRIQEKLGELVGKPAKPAEGSPEESPAPQAGS
jgi:hypothetical protein